MSELRQIGELPENPVGAAVYRRSNGHLYVRLNSQFHVRGRIDGDRLIMHGTAQRIDPMEMVEVMT